jgi:hypothetical protein
MNPEAQRIAIAEACGWHSMDYKSALGIMGMKGPLRGFMLVPDYLNDLNAMHEAEKVLTEKQIRSYAFTLAQVLDTAPTVDLDDQFLNIHATAAQRAEAFLRTVGKWKEEALAAERETKEEAE